MPRQGLGLGLGGLGCDRGFLYCDRVLLLLCRGHGRGRDRMWSRLGGLTLQRKNCVDTGWHYGRAPACPTDELRRDREFSVAVDELCCDREFFVATNFLKFFVKAEIVRPRIMTEILCCDRAWGWGGQGARRQSALDV